MKNSPLLLAGRIGNIKKLNSIHLHMSIQVPSIISGRNKKYPRKHVHLKVITVLLQLTSTYASKQIHYSGVWCKEN